jgi:hypothetical protein
MYKQVQFFEHDWHASDFGANIRCDDCHTDGKRRTVNSAKNCSECHPGYDFHESGFEYTSKYSALSYTDALHQLCVSCHVFQANELNKESLHQCTTCHKAEVHQKVTENLKWETSLPHFNRVVLPQIDVKIIKSEISNDEKENFNN